MKKALALMMGILMMGSCVAVLGGCNNPETPPDIPPDIPPEEKPPVEKPESFEIVTDSASLDYAYNGIYKNNALADPANGFNSRSDIKGGRFKVNNEYRETFTESTTRQDIKLELYNDTSVRVANVAAGHVFTLPTTELTADYEMAKYHNKYTFGDSVLTVSAEGSNPYTSAPNPWYIYCGEWIIQFINSEKFIEANNLERLHGETPYNFTETHAVGDLETKPGYDIYRYDILIKDYEGEDAMPYYHIAVVREENETKNFTLFVMKSKSDQTETMDKIVASYKTVSKKGAEKNYYIVPTPKLDPRWSEETTEYYKLLTSDNYLGWGAFSWSMPGSANALTPHNGNFDQMLSQSKKSQEGIEKIWGHTYDIYPTYTHLSWYNDMHYFPLAMANELAGGNGFNDKPILQFSYQFTTDNNTVATHHSPLFDILRGKYDEHFRRLAKDIKEYGKPVLFRLNNEMNTDWTSYCGMLTLLDPEIFNMTWQRLYDICIEEGATNMIWIWNPIETSSPYSSWGEDINYFPGEDYVQLLGGTNYEFNNYVNLEAAQKSYKSFRTCYKAQYDKNKDIFPNWYTVIGETACGSGGEATGPLGRNAAVQAEYVKDMFKELYKSPEEKEDWAKRIKGLVWFNCNDVAAGESRYVITNRLCFYWPDDISYDYPTNPVEGGKPYADLADTWAAFQEGFKLAPKKEDK